SASSGLDSSYSPDSLQKRISQQKQDRIGCMTCSYSCFLLVFLPLPLHLLFTFFFLSLFSFSPPLSTSLLPRLNWGFATVSTCGEKFSSSGQNTNCLLQRRKRTYSMMGSSQPKPKVLLLGEIEQYVSRRCISGAQVRVHHMLKSYL